MKKNSFRFSVNLAPKEEFRTIVFELGADMIEFTYFSRICWTFHPRFINLKPETLYGSCKLKDADKTFLV